MTFTTKRHGMMSRSRSVAERSTETGRPLSMAYGINPQGGGMNPFDEELGETQSVCHQGGVMQVRTESVAFLPTNSANAQSIGAEDELSPTLAKGGGESGNKPSVAIGFKTRNMQVNAKAVRLDMNMGGDFLTDEAQTIRSGASATIKGGVIMSETIGFKAGQSKDGGLGDEREVSPTLSHKPSALEPTAAYGYDGYNQTANEELCVPLRAGEGDEEKAKVMHMADLSQMRYIVRRLTPTEAERLMGLPDGYLIPAGLRRFFNVDGEPPPELVSEFVDIFDKFNAIMAEYEHKKPPKGKSYNQVAAWLKKISDPATCPDSPMYKCAGNGWATNQPRWILTRLLAIGEGIDPFSTDFAPGGATASASTTGSESPDRDGAGAVNS